METRARQFTWIQKITFSKGNKAAREKNDLSLSKILFNETTKAKHMMGRKQALTFFSL